MKFFRGIVESVKDAGTGLRTVIAMGRGVREIQDRPMMQQRGFLSLPEKGDQILFLQDSGLVVAIASDSDKRPKAKAGEAIVYASAECFIRVMPDGSIGITAPKGLKVEGDLIVTGYAKGQKIYDSTGSLGALRTHYADHTTPLLVLYLRLLPHRRHLLRQPPFFPLRSCHDPGGYLRYHPGREHTGFHLELPACA